MAFQANERHADDSRFASDDAETGALLTAEFQKAVIDIRDWLFAYAKARAEAAEAVAAQTRG